MSKSRNERAPLHLLGIALMLIASVVFSLALSPNPASGDEPSTTSESLAPTAAQTKQFLESGRAGSDVEEPEPDLHAAQTMPHRDLERGEALELAEAVFAPELESAAGIYDELEPEKFVSADAAIVPISSLPEGPGQSGEGLATEHPDMPVLVESMLPLRTENSSGQEEAVDLGLEHSGGELQPQNPLTEVGVPDRLGEGISLPGPEVEVTVAGAPEGRVATDAGGAFAFYPEVAEDTDLVVAPTPEGVETMTDIRSAEAPMQTTYDLALPPGAELKTNKEGGAEVVDGDRTTLLIPAPTAIDAAGDAVQTELSVSGKSIIVGITPSPSTDFPVLVDPTYISEGWNWTWEHSGFTAWTESMTNFWALYTSPFSQWTSYEEMLLGLDISSGNGGEAHVDDQANWEYWVPRYREDLAHFGTAPKTWVYEMYTQGVLFLPWGNYAYYPALVFGLIDPTIGWQSAEVHYGAQGEWDNWSDHFRFTNENPSNHEHDTYVKGADMDMVTYENEYPAKRRDTFMADAYIAVVDEEPPTIGFPNPPGEWMNTTPKPIGFEFEDKGLGVGAASMSYGGTTLQGAGLNLGCSGTTASPCPRIVKSGTARPGEVQASLTYNPAALPTGKDPVTVTDSDPMALSGVSGHTASNTVVLKVDHTAPEVSLSGSLTEQGTLGTRRPTYALRVNAKDGVEGAPQSGVKKVEIKVDGKPVALPEQAEWEPNCQTQNCPFSGEWTLNSSEYGAGLHEVQVVATDAVGNQTTKTVQIELRHPAPTLSVSGSLTEQATLGTERPSYSLNVNASALTESPVPVSLPTYSSSFGTSGKGAGQFSHPGDVAVGPEGDLWVVDTNDNRLEKFSEAGVFIAELGAAQIPAGCQLSRPTAIAITAAGNLVVADTSHRRIVELSPAGACLRTFGSAGTGPGQFAGAGPEGIAVDYHGNIWVSDTYGGRLEKFSEAGVFIRSVGVKGKAYEQLGQPTAIEVAPGGQVYVTDWEDDKVVEYGEGGAFIRQFGSQGNEPGQLQQPTGIAIDSKGDVWVGDQENERVEEFNQAGEYLGRFGSAGSGAGQFNLKYPIGIATDNAGHVWVTDPEDNRVEKWTSSTYGSSLGPTFLRSFGSAGKGASQFETPCGMASDGKGDVWVADLLGSRVEKLTEKGEQLLQIGTGTAGAGTNQFNYPCAVATDRKGHVWVGDMLNNRIEEFSETGTFIRSITGTGSNALLEPLGITVDPKGDLWVSDTGHGRVEEFSETGAFIRAFGTKGSGAGQLLQPRGIAVTAAGQVWVVDEAGNRLEEFSENGTLIREVGGEGSGSGRFHQPCDLGIDAAGNLWVADNLNQRVVELTANGEFIRQFGSAGTGAGQFQTPVGLALDGAGHAFVSDYSVDKIDEWTLSTAHSQISTEITVDGRRVDAGETGCPAETCSMSRSWTLQASSLAPGEHTVVVRATDGLGNTTSKTLHVKVGDTTKPTLEVGGELASAPEGWIEQAEGEYGLHAGATDAGFGVTSLVFSLDGKTVTSKTQSCPGGACSATIATTVNAHELSAGAHPAEVVATDGAGNSATKKWTVNVDPEGKISIEEAEATFEALEATAPVNLIGKSEEEEEYEGTAAGLGVKSGAEGIHSIGGNVPVIFSGESQIGMTLEVLGEVGLRGVCGEEQEEEHGPEEANRSIGAPTCLPRAKAEELAREEEEAVARGEKKLGLEPITITPVGVGNSADGAAVVEGVAVVAPNTNETVDTVTRPLTDGGLDFEDIRSSSAPEHYAFELESYSSELELRQVTPQVITAFYKEGGYAAFTLEAEPAHDADGHMVPTHLALNNPHLVTLTVEHNGIAAETGKPFVYPVVGGTGWQGGWFYGTVESYVPEPPPPGEEEGESGNGEETFISAPERATPEQAGITDPTMIALSKSNTSRYMVRHIRCGAKPYYDDGTGDIELYGPGPFSCGNPFTRKEGSEDAEYSVGVRAWFYNSPGHFVSHRGTATEELECKKMDYPSHYVGAWVEPDWFIDPAQKCAWWGQTAHGGGSYEPVGSHLTAYGEWNTGEGEPGSWKIEQLGTAGYIWATKSGYKVEWLKTTCIDC